MPEQELDFLESSDEDPFDEKIHIGDSDTSDLETYEGISRKGRVSEVDLSNPPSYPAYYGDGCWGTPAQTERDLF